LTTATGGAAAVLVLPERADRFSRDLSAGFVTLNDRGLDIRLLGTQIAALAVLASSPSKATEVSIATMRSMSSGATPPSEPVILCPFVSPVGRADVVADGHLFQCSTTLHDSIDGPCVGHEGATSSSMMSRVIHDRR
jgi:hypothetical protein